MYQNSWYMVFAYWDMGATHNFLSFWVIFCPFTPLLVPKIKVWKKIRRYFLFHMCTINKDSWDIRHNRQKFLSSWIIFCPFIPIINQKIKVLEKWKKTPGNIIILHFLPRMIIIWCMVPDISSSTGKLFSHFGPFFVLLLKNQNFEKKPGDIISLHLCTTNDNHMMYGSLDIRCNWQSFLWTIFCPFDPPKNLENQNFKKWKKNFLEISLFVP